MANECLRKKYKRVVDNSNLPKLGHIILDLKSEENKYLGIAVEDEQNPAEITVISGAIASAQGSAVFIDSTHATITGHAQYTGLTTVDARQRITVDISNYSNLNRIPIVWSERNVDRFHYMPNIKGIRIQTFSDFNVDVLKNLGHLTDLALEGVHSTGHFIGDLSFISSFTNLKSLIINYIEYPSLNFSPSMVSNLTDLESLELHRNLEASFIGNITAFGNLTKLTKLALQECNISGTVEEFVAAQIEAGRSTCSGIQIGLNMGNNVTFQGNPITGSNAKTLSWTSANDISIA